MNEREKCGSASLERFGYLPADAGNPDGKQECIARLGHEGLGIANHGKFA